MDEAMSARETELYREITGSEGKYTKDDIESLQQEFIKSFGRKSDLLADAAKNYSADAQQQKNKESTY